MLMRIDLQRNLAGEGGGGGGETNENQLKNRFSGQMYKFTKVHFEIVAAGSMTRSAAARRSLSSNLPEAHLEEHTF